MLRQVQVELWKVLGRIIILMIFVGERSALQTKLYLKSKSFVTSASLGIGSVLGLKAISTVLN